jgi:ribosomal protein S18 acetylase RimI-like enzyme
VSDTRVRRLATDEFADAVPGLADLLVDAVYGGASLNFLLPFGHADATAWWQARQGAVAAGDLAVWVSGDVDGGDRIDGTVSVVFDRTPNGHHRAEVVKLMVRRHARGRGLGRALLTAAEDGAAAAGRTLLTLDTESGSPAERLYRSAGWTSYGVLPRYATDTSGANLRDCTFFYRELGGSPGPD